MILSICKTISTVRVILAVLFLPAEFVDNGEIAPLTFFNVQHDRESSFSKHT